MLSKPEIRQLASQNLLEELRTSRSGLLKIKFNVKSGHAKESHKIGQLKRYIAQLKTITHEVLTATASETSQAAVSQAQKETTTMPAAAKAANKKTVTKATKPKKTTVKSKAKSSKTVSSHKSKS